jgi:hypothetical protein
MSDHPTVPPTPPAAIDIPDVTQSPPPPPPTLAERVMEWSRPVIAFFGLAIFAVAFGLAWMRSDKDATTFSMLVGAVVTLVSTISGYYFGSSVGSQKKDDVIHSALATAQRTIASNSQ